MLHTTFQIAVEEITPKCRQSLIVGTINHFFCKHFFFRTLYIFRDNPF